MNHEQQLRKFLLRLRADLAADKKKTGVMLVLFCAVLLVGGRMLIRREGPQRAAATTIQPKPVLPAEPASDNASADMDAETWEAHLASLDTTVRRDLFAVRYEAFERIEPVRDESVEKSREEQADDAAVLARQRLVEDLTRRAAALTLQSTMPGSTPSAIINGQVAGEGSVIDGFTVVRIGRGECVVGQSGVEIQLRMAK